MNVNSKSFVTIIGAGITGLVTAFYLKKQGVPFRILEKNPRTGGVIQTRIKDNFIYEKGPNTGVLSNDEVVELFEDLEGKCKLEIADKTAAIRYVWKGKNWQPLPSGIPAGIKTPLFSFRDKLRILREPFRRKGTNPHETLAELVKRRMGKSFLEYAVDPFILGIYAGDPNYLVPKYALPKLYNLEQQYGSFIGGAIKKKLKERNQYPSKATKQVFSVEGGLENLVKALSHEIQPALELNCEAIKVHPGNNGYKITYTQNGNSVEVESDYVISTIGAHQLNATFGFLPHDHLKKITNLEYAKVVEITLGFKNWKGFPLNGFGGLVPFKEQRDILGVLFMSSFLKKRAPEEGALLTIFTGGVRRQELTELDDDKLLKIVEKEVGAMMQIEDFNPDLVELSRYDHAIPQYGVTSGERFETIQKIEEQYPGIILAGNIRDGIGMADRIKQARTIAIAITNKCKNRQL